MCPKCTRAMPAVWVCLFSGIVSGCGVRWTPPDTPFVPPDTTALGVRAELPLIAMWPGETRRIALPIVRCRAGCQFELRGDAPLAFSLNEIPDVFSPMIRGGLSSEASTKNTCIVRVDTLAVPGDTLTCCYAVSTLTKPPRTSHWRLRVVVEVRPAIPRARVEPIQFVTARPNPFSPGATVDYSVSMPGHVSLVVFDIRGQPVATLVNSAQMAGDHTASWNGCDERGKPAGSGVYLLRLTSPAGMQSFKMTLIK